MMVLHLLGPWMCLTINISSEKQLVVNFKGEFALRWQ